MSQLSAQIGDAGDEKATLERIDAIWLIARPDVESTRPELVGGIDTTVDMARTAVVRIRPAEEGEPEETWPRADPVPAAPGTVASPPSVLAWFAGRKARP